MPCIDNENVDVIHQQDEEVQKNSKNEYPSAKLLVEACFQDYMRLQENYNKLYDKLNVALAFSGVVLTLVLGTFDFKPLLVDVSGRQVWEVLLVILHALCIIGSGILLFYGTLRFLLLLTGRQLTVFKSEDIRNDKIYNEKEENAAMWLIDKYTICNNGIRPIIAQKQNAFEQALKAEIIGLILYTAALALGKVGF